MPTRRVPTALKANSMRHEKYQKEKEIVSDNGVLLRDSINQLPDDILVNMLWLLTMKEAGQTSILSTRWRYLWTSHPNLNFDASKIIYNLTYNMLDIDKEEKKKLEDLEKQKYLNWVNHVVRSHTGPTLHEFTVQFELDKADSSHIDEWIHFAFKKNVQRLTLDLGSSCPRNDRYIFPDITLGFHGITSSLTSLILKQINVTGEVLQFFLSASPLLECLVVHESTITTHLGAHSTSLKSLELQFCNELTNVLVTAPNLVSFAYIGHKIELQLSNCPKLTTMSIGGHLCNHFIYDNPMEFSSYLSQLEVLILEIICEYDVFAHDFPVLARVKRLEVTVDPHEKSLLGFASMLKACPSLCEVSFKIHVSDSQPTRGRQSKVASCPHQSLKVVELVGFVGSAAKHLASYLVKNAVKLEKIIFDTRDPADIGTPYEFEETEKRKDAVIHAKYLAKSLRRGVTSVII